MKKAKQNPLESKDDYFLIKIGLLIYFNTSLQIIEIRGVGKIINLLKKSIPLSHDKNHNIYKIKNKIWKKTKNKIK